MQYLDKQGIAVTTFEREAKLSNGYMNNTIDRGADITDKILDRIEKNLPETYYKIFPKKGEVQYNSSNTSDQKKVIQEIRSKEERLPLEQAILNLTDAELLHAEANLVNSRNIERMISLLELKLTGQQSYKVPDQKGEGIISINDTKKESQH